MNKLQKLIYRILYLNVGFEFTDLENRVISASIEALDHEASGILKCQLGHIKYLARHKNGRLVNIWTRKSTPGSIHGEEAMFCLARVGFKPSPEKLFANLVFSFGRISMIQFSASIEKFGEVSNVIVKPAKFIDWEKSLYPD
ncbi:hypothetical protein ACFQY0_19460 [Haloferula chungangensis]|uniref:Uncharacterized protein n=1 Tax=Haloferula chungangensis TaxID=1048331 RepID=A0ABW2LDD8_9BACT